MENILVADIMTRDLFTINPDTNLLECAKKMVKKRTGNLPILNKKRLVGFISQQDILWALIKKSRKDLSTIKAIDISPKKIATIKSSATIKEALSKMKKFKFERLPVINDGELAGMITIKDILSFQPDFYPGLSEFAQVREETEKLKRVRKAKDRDFMHEGMCEECGNQEVLYKINGVLMCESCKSMI